MKRGSSLPTTHRTDGSVEFVREHFPEVELIVNPENGGFSKGYNQALKQVDAEYYVLLNSDIEVTEGWLAPLIRLMDSDPAIGACQPKILSYTDRSHFEYAGAAGGFIDKYGYPFCSGQDLHQHRSRTRDSMTRSRRSSGQRAPACW